MNTHDKIELPPLPEPSDDNGRFGHGDMRGYGRRCARAAIEADRKRQGNSAKVLAELVALIPLADTLNASASCQDLIDYFKGVIADRKRRGEPVAWRTYDRNGWYVISPTLAEAERDFPGKDHQPLYAAPQPAEQADPDFVADLKRSRAKYPGNARMFDGLMGELDELRRAYAGDGDIRAEAFDVAVCAYRIATEGDAGGNSRLTQPAEPVKLECPNCGADRAKEPCAGNLMNCAFKGEAHAAEPVNPLSDADTKHVQDFIACDGMGAVIVEGPQYSAVVRALLARYGKGTR